jgi:hypothetical protein
MTDPVKWFDEELDLSVARLKARLVDAIVHADPPPAALAEAVEEVEQSFCDFDFELARARRQRTEGTASWTLQHALG